MHRNDITSTFHDYNHSLQMAVKYLQVYEEVIARYGKSCLLTYSCQSPSCDLFSNLSRIIYIIKHVSQQ